MSLTANSSLESKKKIFHETYIMSKSRNQTFFGSGGRNESNSYHLARIGEKKIFHKLDVHHIQQGFKRFWAQQAK